MLIALDDPIWKRLYGPYGLEDVSGILRALSENWDETVARGLYWEKLHHQGTLYPTTFAALPWIRKIAPNPPKTSDETPLFLSWVLNCALSSSDTTTPAGRQESRYQGLITDVAAHQWSFLPAEQRLRIEDMSILAQLEAWFTQAAPEIADACVNLVSGNERSRNERSRNAHLLCGPAALAKGFGLAIALPVWSDGETMQIILEEAPPETDDDRTAALSLAARIAPRSPDLARFLRDWAAA